MLRATDPDRACPPYPREPGPSGPTSRADFAARLRLPAERPGERRGWGSAPSAERATKGEAGRSPAANRLAEEQDGSAERVALGTCVRGRGEEAPGPGTGSREGDERDARGDEPVACDGVTEQLGRPSEFGLWELSALGRQSAFLGVHRESPVPVPPAAAQLMVELVQRLARRLSISREPGRNRLRVEIGEGSLAGAVLTVEGGPQGLHVELELCGHHDRARWSEAIQRRLTERGLCVEGVRVS